MPQLAATAAGALASDPGPAADRTVVARLDFLGATSFAPGGSFGGQVVGGLSGLAYDPGVQAYYAIADDRSPSARYFTLAIDLADGTLSDGDVTFTDVQTLSDASGAPFANLSLDPEGIALAADGTFFISSEGDANALIDPFVASFGLDGTRLADLPVPAKFLPVAGGASGIRNNLAFEALTLSPDGTRLTVGAENALLQDGPAASTASGSASRLISYDLAGGGTPAEYVYVTDPSAAEPVPAGGFSTNGLVELLAIDDIGTYLALERSFSTGVGNDIKLFLARTQGATDVSGTFSIPTAIDDGGLVVNLDAAVQKELLLDLSTLGLTLDNVEGMSFGPTLEDGRRTLVLVADDNFAATQVTQFLAFALDLDTVPSLTPTAETPAELRYDGPDDATEGSDPDDPAIYLDAADAANSVVITAMKEGGLRVYGLDGAELSRLEPAGIRYNNVDLLYGVELGGERVDLAVASDRANDTLAIFRIDPDTKALTDVTSADIPASIFGVDDGEATAYGLATYTSRLDGARYAFVTQASGAAIAQLRLEDDGAGGVTATVVRTLDLPVAPGDDPADYQSEGIAIDAETGVGYVTVEGELGLLAFGAEPDAPNTFRTVAGIDSGVFAPDLEGVSILYGADGGGALIVSSQGDSTFAAFDRQTNAYLGSFAVGAAGGIDGVEESDGLDIFSGALGDAFPNGLLVTQDGSAEPQTVFPDPEDGEIQNYAAGFKFTDLAQLTDLLGIGATTYAPRDDGSTPRILTGGIGDDTLVGTGGDDILRGGAGRDLIRASDGDDVLFGAAGDDRLFGENGDDVLFGDAGDDVLEGGPGVDVAIGGQGNDIYVVSDAADVVAEEFDGGFDTVIVTGDAYALPANIGTMLGNGLSQSLTGNASDNRIDGGGGSDVLAGAGGADVFVFAPGSGNDTVLDFEPGSDRLDLVAFDFADAAAVLADAAQFRSDVLLELGGDDRVLVRGVTVAGLADSLFV